jgi:hypothetical protein
MNYILNVINILAYINSAWNNTSSAKTSFFASFVELVLFDAELI